MWNNRRYLQLDLLKKIETVLPVPLVLHGGSGTPHKEVAIACKTGIHKVNISSEFKYAYYQSVKDFVLEHPTAVSPTLVAKQAVEEVRRVVYEKMQVFGSIGKSAVYQGVLPVFGEKEALREEHLVAHD